MSDNNDTTTRRSVLAALGVTVLGGCSSISSVEPPTGEKDSSTQNWPTERRDSEVSRSKREWDGSYRGTDKGTARFVAEGIELEVVGVTAMTQIGVYTGEPIEGNTESIPETEFSWYKAPSGSFLWALTINPIGDYERESLPSPGKWSALPFLEDGDRKPTKPLQVSYSPKPTYYRTPVMNRGELGTYTSPAYGIPENTYNPRDSQDLVFEVPGHSLEVAYGDPPTNWWTYRLE